MPEPPINAVPPVDPQERDANIRRGLDRILASPGFKKSSHLSNFLRFVVEESIAGRGSQIKAYTIAVDALGRSSDFDPQSDPIVRVEAARLRRALDAYYANEGRDDPVVIGLPVGHYAPAFQCRKARPEVVTTLANRWHRFDQAWRDNYRLIVLIAVVAATVSLAIDFIGVMVIRAFSPPDEKTVVGVPSAYTVRNPADAQKSGAN